MPGVAHCGGGDGPDTIDGLSPLVQWVEQDIAPDQIIVSKVVKDVTTFARPVRPYPALPRYSGVGDATKASSFVCGADSDRNDNQPSARNTSTVATITLSSRLATATTITSVINAETLIRWIKVRVAHLR